MQYIYIGDEITIDVSPEDYELRAPVIIGEIKGVAATVTKKGERLTIYTRGVFEVEKAETAESIPLGSPAFVKFRQGRPVFTAKAAKEKQWRFGTFVSSVAAGNQDGLRILLTPGQK